MTVKAHCPKCGKDHEMADKYAGFVEKFHGEVECPECKFGKSNKKADVGKKADAGNKYAKKEITAADFRKAYDELKAEFGADFNIECMAPWVTTILLSKNK